nr:DUF6879 family protein [Actinocorallia herbida]
MFRECTRSAVHLEMRDTYWVSSEDALFNAWKAGHRDDPEDRASWWRPWLGLVEEAVSRGVEVRRARIVSEPVTEYIRFEYDMTFTNVLAGEQVRWLPRRKAAPLALPGCDFWLLDGERVMFNHFNGVGDWAGVEWTKDPEITDLCSSAFDAVWHLATAHEEYRTA